MSTYVSSVDPPDLGLLPTLRRLLRLWREQWKLGVFALSCSLLYTLISIAIPILIQRAIDHAIVPHKEDLLPPYLAAIGGLALLRFGVPRGEERQRIGFLFDHDHNMQGRKAFHHRHLVPVGKPR